LLANTALFGLLPLAVGRALRNRRLLAGQLRARTAQLQRDRDERTRQAGVDERTRIARELHDVVAHSVSVMVIQAQGAQRLAAVDPHLAVEALEAIQSSGRDALREMRGMTGVMRGSDANVEAATPGLAQLPTLADRARAAGMQVELQLPQEQLELSPGLDLIAYRFVQEGLTNAIKHAGPAHAIVSVRSTDERLELEVCDDGGGDTVADTTGAGQGLAGMAERLAVYGGELESGRRPEGGFYVRASTALDAAPRLSEPAVAVAQPAQRPEGHRLAIRYGRYLEIVLALCVAATSAADLIFSRHRQGSVLLNLLIAGLLGGCVFLRRQHALLYATATIGLAVVCTRRPDRCADVPVGDLADRVAALRARQV
jgi:Histidine kinase